MPVYDVWTSTFAWNGTVYGAGTRVIFKDDFINQFASKGIKMTKKGIFKEIYDHKYKFNRYCPELPLNQTLEHDLFFYLTELELQKAIEKIDVRPVVVTQSSAALPANIDKKMAEDYGKIVNFFKYKDKYFGNGTKIYLTDTFIDYYRHKTGKSITKKLEFKFHIFDQCEKTRYYHLHNCDDMKDQPSSSYEFSVVLTEEEFNVAIECVTEPYAIKRTAAEEPIIFIFWILFVLLFVAAFSLFTLKSIGSILALLIFLFYRIRKKILIQ